jgi:hypothetical protein
MGELTNEKAVSENAKSIGQGEKTVIDLNTNLNRDQAIAVLVRAVQVAQSKGVFTLEDAELVSKAVRVIST